MAASRRSGRAAIFVVLLLAAVGLAWWLRRPAPPPEPEAEVKLPRWFDAEAALLTDRAYRPAVRRLIGRARVSIDVLQYLWEWSNDTAAAPRRLLDDLAAAADRGVRVRVLLEDRAADESRLTKDHREVLRWLRARGVDARLDDPDRELHDKLLIVDGGETVVVASHSHSTAALLFNHEASVLVVPRGREAATPALRHFEEAFAEGRDLAVPLVPAAAAAPPAGPSAWPPADDSLPLVPARARWAIGSDYGPLCRALLGRARSSIALGMYYLVPTALVRGHPVDDLLVEMRGAVGRGATVEAVLDEKVQGVGDGANDLARDLLVRLGAVVRFDDPGTISHGKFVAVDGRYALLGSHNWSSAALRENRETSILLDAPPIAEALRRYLRETLPLPGGGSVAPLRPLAPGERLDLNRADARELTRLPGIGDALAERIVDFRTRHGRFRSAAEIRLVSGIGVERYRLIAPHVTVAP